MDRSPRGISLGASVLLAPLNDSIVRLPEFSTMTITVEVLCVVCCICETSTPSRSRPFRNHDPTSSDPILPSRHELNPSRVTATAKLAAEPPGCVWICEISVSPPLLGYSRSDTTRSTAMSPTETTSTDLVDGPIWVHAQYSTGMEDAPIWLCRDRHGGAWNQLMLIRHTGLADGLPRLGGFAHRSRMRACKDGVRCSCCQVGPVGVVRGWRT